MTGRHRVWATVVALVRTGRRQHRPGSFAPLRIQPPLHRRGRRRIRRILELLEQRIEPPTAFDGDVYAAADLPRVPTTLGDATDLLTYGAEFVGRDGNRDRWRALLGEVAEVAHELVGCRHELGRGRRFEHRRAGRRPPPPAPAPPSASKTLNVSRPVNRGRSLGLRGSVPCSGISVSPDSRACTGARLTVPVRTDSGGIACARISPSGSSR